MLMWMIAQQGTDDGFFPDTVGGLVVWAIIAAIIVGLYVLVSRTKRAADDAYWTRRRREEQARRDDPDMRNPPTKPNA